jgi:tRNA dimethylallyltransferase
LQDTHFSLPLLAVVGPSASGKSSLAIQLAKRLDGEIISVDSQQIYRGLTIGTGKVTTAEMEGIPHHLLDIREPNELYDAKQFQQDADRIVRDIASRGKVVILAGGTGLYLRALIRGLFDTPADLEVRARWNEEADKQGLIALHQQLQQVDPVSAERINPNDRLRIVRALEVCEVAGRPMSELFAEHQQTPPRYKNVLQLGLNPPRPLLYERIEQRIQGMLDEGWLEEVRALRAQGYGSELKAMQCIGYLELNRFLDEQESWEETHRLMIKATKTYARRQLTWFRKEEVQWYESASELLEEPQEWNKVLEFLGREKADSGEE